MAAEITDTIVGANVELKGSLKNKGPIQIYGTVNGDIISDSQVIIGETAVINGPISARIVDISGKVKGSINASERIELQAKSQVIGDLITASVSIKPGAIFNGKCQMSTNTEEAISNQRELAEDEVLEAVEKKRPRLEVD